MKPHDNFERANAKEWDEQSTGSEQLIDFETANAKEWDEQSTISIATGAAERARDDLLLIDIDEFPHLPALRGEHFVAAQSGNQYRETIANCTGHSGPALPHRPLSQIPTSGFQQNSDRKYPGTRYYENSGGGDSSTSRNMLIADGSRKRSDGRENRSRHGRPRDTCKQPSTKQVWAEPAGLVTTRRAKDLEEKTKKAEEKKKYLRKPVDEERILTYGFYLWPHEDGSIIEVLGQELETLNPIRLNYSVYVEWVQLTGTQDLLKISSEFANSEQHIAPAIKGIRSAIENAKARAILAAPKYFVISPTASGMRTIVCPKQVITKKEVVEGVEKTKNIQCIGTQLIGSKLSGEEKEKWRKRRVLDHHNNVKDFEACLSSSLMELAALKVGMQMRVHFGDLVVKRFASEYSASQSSLDQFVHMIGLPQLRGEIEKMSVENPNYDLRYLRSSRLTSRRIPAAVAMKLRKKIVDWPERFRPADGRTFSLEDVNFKDTEIIFVKTEKGHELRVEADIDIAYDEDGSVSHQHGSYCVFRDDQSNKRVEILVVDPERQVDYTLQVITDGMVVIPEKSKDFDKLIKGSIPVKTRIRYDSLGLPYPEVHPQSTTGLQIQKVVVRSVSQYALTDSGYVVEIAFYRTWHHNTRSGPAIAASVSMYHPQWDYHMESIENKPDERRWQPGLDTFFDNGTYQDSNGFENFLAEVETIQGFLSDAANEAEV